MIEPELARRFIEQVAENTNFNINIMDERGIIIASRDPDRIGTYHEAAARIIRGGNDVIVVRDDKAFPGVLPGINMAITLEGKREGVVGVTGDPDAIRDVALLTRMAMETMLRFEKQQEALRLRRSRKEHFLTLLTQTRDADLSELRGIARQLDYNEALIRVPILCRLNRPGKKAAGIDPDLALERLRQGKGHWQQDLSFVLDEDHLLVFKTVRPDRKRGLTECREVLAAYLSSLEAWLRRKGADPVFYIGTLQSGFSQYYYAYRHCRWLETHVKSPGSLVFFTDYIREYFRTLLPRQELQSIYQVYDTILDRETRSQLTEIIGALEEANYNLTRAAKSLYIHKNTMTYRYNRAKDLLGGDPLENPEDRSRWEHLYLYLAH